MKPQTPPSVARFLQILAAGAALGALAVAAPAASETSGKPPYRSAGFDDGFVSVADLVEEVTPAVVSVMVEREVRTPRMPSGLEDFFFRFGAPGDERFNGFGDDGAARRMEAQGSGFFIDAAGHIVTNNHVVEGADEVRVRLNSGDELVAEVVGTDPETDLAVLKVTPPKDQKYVSFAEDVKLRVGDRVVAVGNPFGLSGTVTSGIVSAMGREGGQFTDFIQIDAPINRGNSGGPTFDLEGRVVGVNTAIYSTNGGSVGIGFAIPSKLAKQTVAQLIASGSVTRGWLGVSLQPVDKTLAAAFGRDTTDGALVAEVLEGTPAEKAGIESGDLVVAINGDPVKDTRDLSQSVSALAPGEKARVKLIRDGKEKIINVTLGKRTADGAAGPETAPGADSLADDLGLRLAEIDDAVRTRYRLEDDARGVIVAGVRAGSPAEEAGLQAGAVILQVDGETVSSGAEVKAKIENATRAGKDAVLLRTQTGTVKQFAALPLAAGEE